MKKIALLILILLFCFLGCKIQNNSANQKTVTLIFEAKSSSTVSGTAVFVEKNGVVTLTANISGLKPGLHGIHIHEKADCSSPDGKSAGGHWNPTFKNHGKGGDSNCHRGDIDNFEADENGNGKIIFATSDWCINCDDATKNIVGKGLIVHQDADDFQTQPAGNSGSRVACGGIIQ